MRRVAARLHPSLSAVVAGVVFPLILLAASSAMASKGEAAVNVLGGILRLCCLSPRTGFFRDGFCHTGPSDTGRHVVCAQVTQAFLDFSRSRGNDLVTPHPPGFPGLRAGDKW